MSSTLMPVVFVSHGSPEIAVRETPAHKFLNAFASDLTQPKQILVVSAHWETEHPLVATGETPETIYDFGPRFDKRLWDITYDAPGAVDLARDAETLLREAGFEVGEDGARGRDHGVWTPLHLMFPARRIPVTQLSIQPALSPRHHFEIGRALRPLRERGVLILASGAITHNLSEFRGREIDDTPPDWVIGFRDWMHDKIIAGDVDALLDYRASAPHGERNHPEDEHLLPIFTALGAAGARDRATRAHASVEYGVIGMDAYRWDAA
jgi:4,5-DOPA dioxygenase extradiol